MSAVTARQRPDSTKPRPSPLRAIARTPQQSSSSTEHGHKAVSSAPFDAEGEPAQESSGGHKISSLRHFLCWIPAALGLTKPSHDEDDGRFSFERLPCPDPHQNVAPAAMRQGSPFASLGPDRFEGLDHCSGGAKCLGHSRRPCFMLVGFEAGMEVSQRDLPSCAHIFDLSRLRTSCIHAKAWNEARDFTAFHTYSLTAISNGTILNYLELCTIILPGSHRIPDDHDGTKMPRQPWSSQCRSFQVMKGGNLAAALQSCGESFN